MFMSASFFSFLLDLIHLWSLDPLNRNSGAGFHKIVNESIVRKLGEHNLFPEVRSQVAVGLRDSIKSHFDEIAQGSRPTPSWCVMIINTFWAQEQRWCQRLWGQGWYNPAQNQSAQSLCMEHWGAWQSCFPSSLSSQRWWKIWERQWLLGDSGYFFGICYTKTHMTIVVPNSSTSHQPGLLASPCLFLHRYDL